MSSSVTRRQVWNRTCSVRGLVEHLEVKSSPVLAPGVVRFRRLTALTGIHGAGKSYLLSAIAAGLPRWQVTRSLPIESSESDAELTGDYSLTFRSGEPRELVSFSRPVHWKERQEFDDSLQPWCATLLTPYLALDELAYFNQNLGPHWPREPNDVVYLKRSQIESLREITGYAYESVTYGRFGDRDEYFPYFRVTRDSREYDALTMSASEFWVHYVIWHLRNADTNEVVLIDEPETFLAEPGHQGFVDEIARAALESGCQVILATHSAAMIRRVPAELIRQVSSTTGGAAVSEVSSTDTLLRAMGRSPAPIALLIFVEDEMARTILRFFFCRYASERAAQVDIIDSGGKDEAVRGGAVISGRSLQFRTVAVLDGDQRGLYADEKVLFLPGASDPETLLLDVLRSQAHKVAGSLGVTFADLLLAVDTARFVPHQRIFDAMNQALGSSRAELIHIAVSVWLDNDEIANAARRLVEQALTLIISER